MIFPDPIDPNTFATLDGRFTTEANVALTRAWKLLEQGRFCSDLSDLRKMTAVIMMHARASRLPRPQILPALAVMEAGLDREIWSGGLKMWFAGKWMALMARLYRRWAEGQMSDDAPGWNDYHLAYWMMTGDPETLEEIYVRTAPADWPGRWPVQSSAVWMVNSVRSQLPDFDLAIAQLERSRGRAIARPVGAA